MKKKILSLLVLVMTAVTASADADPAFKITVGENAHGTFTFKVNNVALIPDANGKVGANEDDEVFVTVTPATGYVVNAVTGEWDAAYAAARGLRRGSSENITTKEEFELEFVSENQTTGAKTYKFTMISANAIVCASYKKLLTNTDITVATIPDQTFTGQAIEPTVTVKDGQKDITDQCDISYEGDKVNTGQVTVTIAAKTTSAGYAGQTTTTFNIVAKPVTPTVTVTGTYTFTGQALTPTVVVKDGETMIDAKEYTVGWEYKTGENTYTTVSEVLQAGTYRAVVKDNAEGNYTIADGTASADFTVSNPVMNGVSYVDIVNGVKTTRTADNVTVLCGTESTLKSGFYVALPSYDGKALDLTKYDRIAIDGNVSIILADGATMHVENPGGWCIIGSNDDGNANWTDGLKIYGQSAQTGTISTVGYKGGIYVGTLAIYGGNITDNGTSTPCFDADGDVSILNGNVTGTIHSGGRLTVSGGNVTSVVPDGQSGYAITSAGDLSVSGGVVTAIADRGQALRSNNGNVSISGGQVTADGSSAGIRVGYGRTVTLGWTAESDYIFASSYAGTVRTASGQRFLARNGGGNNSPVTGIVSGSYNNMNAFNSMMLRPLIGNFVSTGDGLNIADREKSFSLDNKDYYITALDADVKVGYSGSGLVKTGVQPASITLSDEHGFKMPAEDVILTATAVSGLAVSESFIYNGSGQVPGSLTYGTGGSMTADDFSIEGISQGGTAASEAINAGDYTAALKGKGVYIGSESVDFSIGVRTVTVADGITAGSKDYDGTTDVTIDCMGAAFGNIVEGDDLSVSGITGAFADATAGKDKEIALDYSAAVLGGEDAGNYVLAADGNQAVATATIRTIDIVGITATGYEGIYDGAAHTINVDGVPADAAITFGTSDDGCTLTETPALTDVGEMTVYYKVSKANYNDVTGSATVKVGVRTVTVASGITAGSKDYDGTTDVTIDCSGAAFSNLVEGETITISGVTGAFADADAGEDKVVTLDYSEAVLGGNDAGNYVLATDAGSNQATATATINTIDIVGITATGYDAVYDGETHTITVNDVPEGATLTYGTTADDCTLTEAPALTDVGEMTVYYKVTKANYNDVTGSEVVKVGVRTVTVANGITAGSKDYDGTTDVTIDCTGAAFDNLVEGESITISGVSGAFADADAGADKDVSLDYSAAVLGGEDAGNYVLAADGNQAVATASISTIDIVGITATGYEAIYDGEAHSITVNDVPEGAIVTYGASAGECTLTENPAFTNVGENTVYYLVTKANYNDVTGSATVIITPKDVTVTTGSATKAYDGEPLTCAEATIIGLVEGESVVVTTTGSQTVVGTSDNTYTIDWGNYLSDNYTITDELGTLEVTFATIAYNGASIKKDENGYYINMAENSGNAKPLPIDGTVVDLRYGRVLLAPGEDGEGDLTIDGQAANLYTVCLPFKPKAARNAKYYTLRRVEDSTLKFEEVTSPEAFMPYLVSVTGSNDVFETCKDVTFEVDEHIYSTTVSGFTFTGTLKGLTNREARTAAGGSNKVTYFLQRKAKWGKVVKGDVYLPPFRAYIIGPEVDTGNARALDSSFDGEATEIWNIQTVDADGTERWYDLNGRRIEKPTQTGIYIHNGRKEVIR